MSAFTLSFSPASISELARFAGFQVLLAEEVQTGMSEGADDIVSAAQANTWQVFTSPSGELADTIAPVQMSPYEIQIVVSSPYGRRREEGFSGQTDSLGRFYPNDPGKPYLSTAMDAQAQSVLAHLEQAVERALQRLA